MSQAKKEELPYAVNLRDVESRVVSASHDAHTEPVGHGGFGNISKSCELSNILSPYMLIC